MNNLNLLAADVTNLVGISATEKRKLELAKGLGDFGVTAEESDRGVLDSAKELIEKVPPKIT